MFKKGLLFVLLVVGVGLGIWACSSGQQEEPDVVLGNFIQLWQQEDYSGMYELLSAEAQERWEEEVFVTRYENISSGIGLGKIDLVEAEYIESEARLQYVLDFTTHTVGEFRREYTMEVVEQEEGWHLVWDHCHIFPELEEDLVVRVSRQLPQRGSILDRENRPLAGVGNVYNVGLVPGKMDTYTTPALSEVLGIPTGKIVDLLDQAWVREDTFVPIQSIGKDAWTKLEDSLLQIRGVMVREENSRVYDIPQSLAQTVGYVGEVPAKRLEKLEEMGFRTGDIVGQAGLELVHDGELAGRPGFTITIRDEDNNIVSVLAQRELVEGSDVTTTLDLEKTRLLDSVLGDNKGSILLMDFNNGEIISAVSKPGFDSNAFALGITSQQYNELQELDAPFVNRAINGLYPPGSAFKPFTALMALEEGIVDPEYAWDTPRQWQPSSGWGDYHVTRVTRPMGEVNLWEAMKWSDNVYFADLGLKLGWSNFESYAAALGFGAKLPLALNHNSSQLRGDGGGDTLLAESSFGQGEMLTTPLHLSLMYAALARQDGIMPVARLTPGEAESWLETGFSTEKFELVDQVLAFSASDSETLAWVGQETVRGKTGTSEISRDRQIAWYVCYFDNYILTVTLEGDSSISSTQAAALARECLDGGLKR